MKELGKRGLYLVIATMVLLLLPFTVHADEKYTITFESNGGTAVEPIEADTWNEVKNHLPFPEKENNIFEGWYLDEEYTNKVYRMIEEPEEHNLTLYARWIDSEHMIDMSKVNLTIDDLIAGTELTLKEDSEGNTRFGYIQTPSVNIKSSDTHVKIQETIIGDGSDYVEGALEEGKDYYITIFLVPEDGYLFNWPIRGAQATMLINGKEVGEVVNYGQDEYDPEKPIMERSNYETHLRVKVTAVKKEYSILEGANQTYTKGKDLTIKADGELEKFVKLLVDDKEVSEDNYTKKSGSTIITLKSSYLETLSAGNHEITFVYNNGTVKTNLTIENKTNNPKTGDSMMIYLITGLLSIVGFISLIIYKKKQTN